MSSAVRLIIKDDTITITVNIVLKGKKKKMMKSLISNDDEERKKKKKKD